MHGDPSSHYIVTITVTTVVFAPTRLQLQQAVTTQCCSS